MTRAHALSALLADDAARPQGGGDPQITSVTLDSRTVGPGALFAGLRGEKVDGATFVPKAVAAGAAAVLVGEDASLVWPDGAPPADVPIIRSKDPRRLLARIASRFHGGQPATTVAVTGTSGKSSVAEFTRQLFAASGYEAASLGTIGLVRGSGVTYGGLTTPDPVSLQAQLANLADDGVTHLAFEASSHGLEQRRLDGVRLTAAGFTNLGRDHLDFHPTVEDYFTAKLRLFQVLLPASGTVVVNVDGEGEYAARVVEAGKARGQTVVTAGRSGREIRIVQLEREGFDQRLTLEVDGRTHTLLLPLPGDYQVANAVVALGLAIAGGVSVDDALAGLTMLTGVPGRMDIVARVNGALAVVDYAHKPEALAAVLTSLRPYATNRLICVFGCGGDRDAGKRPLMGEISARLADITIVTDDNPRTEDPAAIRAAVMAAAPGALEIGDRAKAINHAAGDLRPGDVLVVAGKGHETGQLVGKAVLPFSDHDVLRLAVAGLPGI